MFLQQLLVITRDNDNRKCQGVERCVLDQLHSVLAPFSLNLEVWLQNHQWADNKWCAYWDQLSEIYCWSYVKLPQHWDVSNSPSSWLFTIFCSLWYQGKQSHWPKRQGYICLRYPNSYEVGVYNTILTQEAVIHLTMWHS